MMAGKPAPPTPLPPGHVRLLETEPMPEERLGHAAALLEIIKQQETQERRRANRRPRAA